MTWQTVPITMGTAQLKVRRLPPDHLSAFISDTISMLAVTRHDSLFLVSPTNWKVAIVCAYCLERAVTPILLDGIADIILRIQMEAVRPLIDVRLSPRPWGRKRRRRWYLNVVQTSGRYRRRGHESRR
jgi:hypothetical protein